MTREAFVICVIELHKITDLWRGTDPFKAVNHSQFCKRKHNTSDCCHPPGPVDVPRREYPLTLGYFALLGLFLFFFFFFFCGMTQNRSSYECNKIIFGIWAQLRVLFFVFVFFFCLFVFVFLFVCLFLFFPFANLKILDKTRN